MSKMFLGTKVGKAGELFYNSAHDIVLALLWTAVASVCVNRNVLAWHRHRNSAFWQRLYYDSYKLHFGFEM